jgi:hypothetical protein
MTLLRWRTMNRVQRVKRAQNYQCRGCRFTNFAHAFYAAAYGRRVRVLHPPKRALRAERGQAGLEWVGLVLLVSLALAGGLAAGPHVDGRSLGGFLAHRFVCAVKRSCHDGDAALTRAYGRRDAVLARREAPNLVYEPGERELPVDYRRCRSRACSDAPEDRDLDSHRTDAGRRATVFVHRVRRGRRTYLQYFFYYPDSNSTWAGSSTLWNHSALRLLGRYPGFHLDDWEGYQVRIDPDGRAWGRASAHGHYQGCKQLVCKNRWVRASGWTRVSRGSHAGHIPGRLLGLLRGRFRPSYPGADLRERTTTAEGLRLVPLESLDHRGYRALDDGVEPPWRKEVYRRPKSDSS